MLYRLVYNIILWSQFFLVEVPSSHKASQHSKHTTNYVTSPGCIQFVRLFCLFWRKEPPNRYLFADSFSEGGISYIMLKKIITQDFHFCKDSKKMSQISSRDYKVMVPLVCAFLCLLGPLGNHHGLWPGDHWELLRWRLAWKMNDGLQSGAYLHPRERSHPIISDQALPTTRDGVLCDHLYSFLTGQLIASSTSNS